MDIVQLFNENNLYSLLVNFFNTEQLLQVKATLLYFYSTVAQSMAALFTVSGFYAIFRLQSIDAKLGRSYGSYREWINIRLISLNIPQIHRNKLQEHLAKQGVEILNLGVDIEPHSWLEKDMLDHAKSNYDAAKKNSSSLERALRDYYRHFSRQSVFRSFIKILSVFPLLIIGYLFLNALTQISYLHLVEGFNKFFYINDLMLILKLCKWLFIYLFVYILIATFGLSEINDNNPIVYLKRKSGTSPLRRIKMTNLFRSIFGLLKRVFLLICYPKKLVKLASAQAPSANIKQLEETFQLMRRHIFRAFYIAAGTAVFSVAVFLTLSFFHVNIGHKTLAMFRFFGYSFLLWGIFSPTGWKIKTIGGESLPEIIDEEWHRLIYMIGLFLLLLSYLFEI